PPARRIQHSIPTRTLFRSRQLLDGVTRMRRAFAVAIFVCLGLPTAVFAQRTSVSGDFPFYANGGKPDLTVDPKRFVSQMEIVDRDRKSTRLNSSHGSISYA